MAAAEGAAPFPSTDPQGFKVCQNSLYQDFSQGSAEADVLTVSNNKDLGLMELEATDGAEFPYSGSPADLEAQVEEVQRLLAASSVSHRSSPALSQATTLKPQAGGPKPRRPKKKELPLASYGHDPHRVQEIKEANQRLVKRLVVVATAPAARKAALKEHERHMANAKASSLTRKQKEEDKVAEGNAMLYRKLQAVRASSVVSRAALDQQWQANRRRLQPIKREGPRPAPPGMGQPRKKWDDNWDVNAIFELF